MAIVPALALAVVLCLAVWPSECTATDGSEGALQAEVAALRLQVAEVAALRVQVSTLKKQLVSDDAAGHGSTQLRSGGYGTSSGYGAARSGYGATPTTKAPTKAPTKSPTSAAVATSTADMKATKGWPGAKCAVQGPATVPFYDLDNGRFATATDVNGKTLEGVKCPHGCYSCTQVRSNDGTLLPKKKDGEYTSPRNGWAEGNSFGDFCTSCGETKKSYRVRNKREARTGMKQGMGRFGNWYLAIIHHRAKAGRCVQAKATHDAASDRPFCGLLDDNKSSSVSSRNTICSKGKTEPPNSTSPTGGLLSTVSSPLYIPYSPEP